MAIENIIIPPISVILSIPKFGGFQPFFLNEANLVSLQMNFTLTGGSFTATVLQNSFANPIENLSFTLPNGRTVTLKQTSSAMGRGGLIQTLSGPCVSPAATLINTVGVAAPGAQFPFPLAQQLAGPIRVFWETFSPLIVGFVFRGPALSGIQQLAGYILGDVIVRNGSGGNVAIHVVDPGAVPFDFTPFNVPVSDIVSISQLQDYSLDVSSVLNPALGAIDFNNPGDFIYDSDHAQKQGKFTVQAGAPGSQGSTDFIPIPDGWLIDGNFEEWAPQNPLDLTNPNPSVTNGRYWKVFQSPTNPAMLRGITNFTRLVKTLNLPGNVSPFVGSPITGVTRKNTTLEFAFNNPGTQKGIYGFNAEKTIMFDVISNQFLTLPSCLVIRPNGQVSSGEAASNFFSITMELWTFPLVLPVTFPVGDPTNPFGLPPNVVVVSPSSQVSFGSNGAAQQAYFSKYLANYRLINSPRYRTTLSCLYRGVMPQPGDTLNIVGPPSNPNKLTGIDTPKCGRIQSVGLTLSRSALLLNITAELYNYSPDGNLSLIQPGSTVFQ